MQNVEYIINPSRRIAFSSIFAQIPLIMNGLSKVAFYMFAIFLFNSAAIAQELKKKLRVSYSGVVPSYFMEVGEQLVEVDQAQLLITFISGNKIQEQLGSSNLEGTYRITSESKSTITIQVNYPNQLVYEELEINKKEKKMIRRGFYPQPNATLMMNK